VQNPSKVAIITGITGQDGAYLAKFLLEKEYLVIGLTRSYNTLFLFRLEYLGIAQDIITIEADLLDISSIIKVLLKYKPTEIYNLSAQSSVGLSFQQPIGTINFNITSFLNILESVRILELPTRIYQASSSEMFGQVNSLPITINTPMHPMSPYAVSKATAYWLGINYRESYGLYISNGILFNHESYLRGDNFFVKKVIRDSLLIKKGLKDKLIVGNIDIKRDFGFAPKYVEAMWLSLQKQKSGDYLICSGKSISLREIIMYIFRKLDIPLAHLEIDKELFRPSEIKDIYGDNSNAKENLDWNYDMDFTEALDIILQAEIDMFEKTK
jgi:GDPmannose 4,6-dehydratase